MTNCLYLHGFASSPQSRKARYYSELLRKHGVELLVPDLAEGDFPGLSLSRQLALVERLAASSPIRLIGSSMGGYLAALYAARHPEVERVVLLAPAFGFARRWVETLGAQQVEAWQQTGRLEVYHYGEQRMLGLGYQLIEDGGLYEDYPDVRQPALVIHGLRDTVVPVEYSREFAARQPNAQLIEVDSDHELADALDATASEILRFLSGRP